MLKRTPTLNIWETFKEFWIVNHLKMTSVGINPNTCGRNTLINPLIDTAR